MLKPILLGTAMLFALPALAQTTGSTQGSGTATTTNDHDPTAEDLNATAHGAATVGTQVNGGVLSGQTTTTGTAGTSAQGSTGTNHNTTDHRAMGHGTANSGTAQGTTSGAMAAGTMPGGTMSGAATGTMTGVGGPLEGARDYPPCSRTVTDSCIQTYERGRR